MSDHPPSDDEGDQLAKPGSEPALVDPGPVGYGRPPAASRFKPGISGNPRGRPKNSERSWTARQLNADILREANREITLTNKGKTERLPSFRLMVRRVLNDGINGHLPSAKFADKLISRAIGARRWTDHKFYDALESMERDLVSAPGGVDEADIHFLNLMRKYSRQV